VPRSITRRQFLGAAAAGTLIAGQTWAGERRGDSLSFGLVTDIHYADVPSGGSRHYRDSLAKLGRAVETFRQRKVSFVAELGDFVDAGPGKEADLKYLAAARKVFEAFSGPRHFVLGNHCLARLTKQEFLAACGANHGQSDKASPHYSFDRGPYHFVVLDANFKRDGSPYAAGNFSWTDTVIPEPQLKWLAGDLKNASDKKTVVLVHQNLDKEDDPHGVKNAPQVRKILEAAGNVLAVFQGHMHTGGYRKVGGIHYCTLRAMVEGPAAENNAYAIVTLGPGDRVALEPFARQPAMAFG